MERSLSLRSELVKRTFKKPKKKWLYTGVAVIVVLGAGIPTLMRTLGSSPSITSSNIYQVGYGSVTQTVSTSGTVQSPTEISLNFQNANGPVKTLKVKIGDHVKAGQVLAQVDDSSAKIQLAQAQANVTQAQVNLSQGLTNDKLAVTKAQLAYTQSQQQYQDEFAVLDNKTSEQQQITTAQNTLTQDEQKANDTSPITIAQQQLSNAQSNLVSAQQQLSIAQAGASGVTATTVQLAYAAYQAALGGYNSWQSSVSNSGPNPYEAAMQNADAYYNQVNGQYQAVQQAQQSYNQASLTVTQDAVALTNAQNAQSQAQQQIQTDQQNLQIAQNAYNNPVNAKQSLDNVENQVNSAKMNLQSAQSTLSQDESNSATGASLQSAQLQLQSAQLTESNTTLKAPIDGVVTQLNAIVGETVSGSTAAIVIDDIQKEDLQVSLQLSESQIATVKSGQSITYTASAYPGKAYQGTITEVYPTPQVVSNVTQYTVLATIDNTSGDLKPGMTVSATIQTAEKTHVITVPAIALHQVGNREGVYVYGTQPQATSAGQGGNRSQTGNATGFGGSTGSGQAGSGGWTGGSGGGGGNGGYAGGSSGGSGGFGGGSGSGGKTGARSGGSSGASGGFGGASGYSGTSSLAAASTAKLPSGVYFQVVQTGLFGSNSIEITRGLQVGEKILLVLPGAATTQSTQSTSGSGFRLGVGGGGGGGGRG